MNPFKCVSLGAWFETVLGVLWQFDALSKVQGGPFNCFLFQQEKLSASLCFVWMVLGSFG